MLRGGDGERCRRHTTPAQAEKRRHHRQHQDTCRLEAEAGTPRIKHTQRQRSNHPAQAVHNGVHAQCEAPARARHRARQQRWDRRREGSHSHGVDQRGYPERHGVADQPREARGDGERAEGAHAEQAEAPRHRLVAQHLKTQRHQGVARRYSADVPRRCPEAVVHEQREEGRKTTLPDDVDEGYGEDDEHQRPRDTLILARAPVDSTTASPLAVLAAEPAPQADGLLHQRPHRTRRHQLRQRCREERRGDAHGGGRQIATERWTDHKCCRRSGFAIDQICR
mmetsp:Transcript_68986/g.224893  ORF Transcript_68986/g.224893 Transcript_68986/m.224893 type:complete len:281 (+) Transcript_68986:152-994(+)